MQANVDVLVLCDTNGGTLPWEVKYLLLNHVTDSVACILACCCYVGNMPLVALCLIG